MKSVAILVGMTVAAMALTSCASSPQGGQSSEDAKAALKTLPGVIDASIEIEKDTSGISATNANRAAIVLDMDGRISNEAISNAEIDFILQTGWSLSAGRSLARGVTVGVEGAPEISVGKLLERAGWVESGAPVPGAQSGNVPARLLEDRFGDWPAKPPASFKPDE